MEMSKPRDFFTLSDSDLQKVHTPRTRTRTRNVVLEEVFVYPP